MQARHDRGGFRHRGDDVVGEGGRVGGGEAHALDAIDAADRAQQVREGAALAESHTVGVHVLSQQGHLDGTLRGNGLDLSENVAGATITLLAAQVRHDAEGARVVAAHGDRHPRREGALAVGGQGRGEDLQGFLDLDGSLAVVLGAA